MARNGRYKSKSDYTLLTKKHQNIENGTIFETDYMTLSKIDELFSNQKPVYSDGPFIFTERMGVTDKRRHTRYGWDGGIYTLENLSTEETKSDETKVKIRPDYTTLKSFAYYGSATDLINATINGVVKDFPAELYFSDKTVYIEDASGTSVTTTKYYEISNPFDINTYTKSVNDSSVTNPLRYLVPNFSEYELIDNTGNTHDISSVAVYEYSSATCEDYQYIDIKICDIEVIVENGEKNDLVFPFHLFSKNNRKVLLYADGNSKLLNSVRIRPKREIIEKYFNSIDDFTYTLLNRRSLPIYTAKLYTTTFSDEKGYETAKKSYTWPTDSGGYNPLVSNAEFDNYLSSLIELAEYYDEYESDNIWRSMTHEAIKNLDWTFASNTRDSVEGDLSPLNTTRIEAVCKLYGRLFDELKLYIDGIKNSNAITYNGNNNAPDYVLTDMLETMGWKPKSLTLELDNEKTNRLYPSENDGYTATDANKSFLRRLILNSAYLFSLKGTRAGIDTLMALFGYDNDEFEVNEYVLVDNVQKDEDGNTNLLNKDDIIEYNRQKNTFLQNIKNGEEIDDFDGLPLNSIDFINSKNELKTYVFPWFDKSKKYDSKLYFQGKGGWEKEKSRIVNIENLNVQNKEISGDNFYNETKPIIKYVNKLSELFDIDKKALNNDDICYVNNISDLLTYYNKKDGEVITGIGSTHYFIIKNKNYSNVLGYVKSIGNTDIYGWKMITSKFETGTVEESDYYKVLYYESIKDNTEGNNPHIGNGLYDEGKYYADNLNIPFLWDVENDKFPTSTNTDKIRGVCFNLEEKINDNRKCWYFTDRCYYKNSLIKTFETDTTEGDTVITSTTCEVTEYENNFIESNYFTDYKGNNGMSKISPVNYEDLLEDSATTLYNYEEGAVNSVVNIKNVDITFKCNNENEKNFINNIIMHYLRELIPSTAITELMYQIPKNKTQEETREE